MSTSDFKSKKKKVMLEKEELKKMLNTYQVLITLLIFLNFSFTIFI